MSALAKNASAIIPPLAASFVFNADLLVTIMAIIGGLIFGGMWRAGSLVSEGKGWAMIRRDASISILIGGANAILTLAIIRTFDLNVLIGMAIAVVIGATGLRALPEMKAVLLGYARRKLIGDVVLLQPRDAVMDEQLRRIRDMERDPPN